MQPFLFAKLVIVNFGGIGDEILFLPTLARIRTAYPKAHISLILEPRSKSVQEITNLIDEVITFDIKKKPLTSSDLLDLLGLLRQGNYDCVISSGASPLVSLLLFLSGIPKRVGYDSGIWCKFFLSDPVPLKRNQYAADMYQDLIAGIGLTPKHALPGLTVPASSIKKMENFLHSSLHSQKAGVTLESRPIVIVHPGTSLLALKKGITKTWPTENWSQSIERLLAEDQITVVLAGGPDDEATIRAIEADLQEKGLLPQLVQAYGHTETLADLAALIKLSDLLICVDSAAMHIAVGLSKPTLALFGPTDPKLLVPPDRLFKVVESKSFVWPNAKSANSKRWFPFKPDLGAYRDGLKIPPDVVFKCVLDQLQAAQNLKGSRESRV